MATYNLDIKLNTKIGQSKAQLSSIVKSVNELKKGASEANTAFSSLAKNLKISTTLKNIAINSEITAKSMSGLAKSMDTMKGKDSILKGIRVELANMKASMPNTSSMTALGNSLQRLGKSASHVDAINKSFGKITDNSKKLVKMEHTVVGLSMSFDMLNNGLKAVGVSSKNMKDLVSAATMLDRTLRSLTGLDRLLRDLKTLKSGKTTINDLRDAVKKLSAENLAYGQSQASVASDIKATVVAGESYKVLLQGIANTTGTLSKATESMGKMGEVGRRVIQQLLVKEDLANPFKLLDNALVPLRKNMVGFGQDTSTAMNSLNTSTQPFKVSLQALTTDTNVFKQAMQSTKGSADNLVTSLTSFNALSGSIKGFDFGMNKVSSDMQKHAEAILRTTDAYANLTNFAPKLTSSLSSLSTSANDASKNVDKAGKSAKKAKSETDKLNNSSLKKVSREAKGLRNTFSDLQQIVKGILISQVFYRGLGAVQDFTSAVLESYMSLEQLKASLELFDIQSSTGDAVGTLTQFSEELVMMSGISDHYINQAIRQWSSLGYTAEQTKTIMTSAANVAVMSGRQTDFESINRALRQIRTNGKLMGEELNQLGDAGVEAKKYIQEAFQLDPKQMANIGSLNISSDKAIQAIVGGLQRDFGDAMAKMQNTTRGALNQIKSTSVILFRDIYQSALESFSGIIFKVRDLILVFRELQTQVDGGLKNALLSMLPPQLQQALFQLAYWLDIIKNTIMSLLPYLFQFGTTMIQIASTAISAFAPVIYIIVSILKAFIYVVSHSRLAMMALGAIFLAFNVVLPITTKALGLWNTLMASTTMTNMRAIFSMTALKAAYVAAGGGIMGTISAVTGAFTAAFAVLATNPLFWALLGGGLIMGLGMMAGKSGGFGDKLKEFEDSMAKAKAQTSKVLNPELTKTSQNADKTAMSLENTTNKTEDFGNAAEEAGNKAKKASAKLLSFDEIFQLTEDTADGTNGLGDLNIPDITMPDLDTGNLENQLGDIQGMLDDFSDWMLDNAFDLNDGMIGAWTWADVWATAKATLSDILYLLGGFQFDTLIAGIKLLGEAFGGLKTTVFESLSYVGNQLVNWGSLVTSVLSSTLSAMGTWVTTMVGHTWTWASESLSAWDKWFTDTLTIWQTWSSNTLQIGWEWVGSQLSNIWYFISESAVAIGNWCGETITTWTRWSIDSLGVIGWFIGQSAMALWDWTKETGGAIWEWCGSTGTNIYEWSVDAWTSISTWGSETWDIFSGWFGDTVEGFSGWVWDALQSLFDFENWSISSLWDWVSDSWDAFWSWGKDTKDTFTEVGDANDKLMDGMAEANKNFGDRMDTDTQAYRERMDRNSKEMYGKTTAYAQETSSKLNEYWERGLSEQDKTNTTYLSSMETITKETYDRIQKANQGASTALKEEWDKAWTDQIKTTETRSEELGKASSKAWENITNDHKKIWAEWDKNINTAWDKTIKESDRLTEQWKTNVGKALGDMTVGMTKIFQDWWKDSMSEFMRIGNGMADTLTGGTYQFEDKWQKSFNSVLGKTDKFIQDIERKMSTMSIPEPQTSSRNPFRTSTPPSTMSMYGSSQFRYTPPNIDTNSVGNVTQTSRQNSRNTQRNIVQLSNEQISLLSQNNSQPLLVVENFIGDDRGLRKLERKLNDIRKGV